MFHDDLLAEVIVHATQASSSTVPQSARNLVQARRGVLMQRRFQRALNLLGAAFWRRLPDISDLARSLRSRFGRELWVDTVHKAGDGKFELIPRV